MVDRLRNHAVPVGVALWGSEPGSLRFRLPSAGERIPGVHVADVMGHAQAVQAELEHYLETKTLPFTDNPPPPLSDAWWEYIQQLLHGRLRFEAVRPIGVQDPEQEIQSLFEALVQPRVSAVKRTRRVDDAVKKALGRLLNAHFHKGGRAIGFRQKPVAVLRCAGNEKHLVVIDGINLALKSGIGDADELASRVRRLKRGPRKRELRVFLGYLASPEGLNGEKFMKEWVEKETGVTLFDLDRERDDFRRLVRQAWREAPAGGGLFDEPESSGDARATRQRRAPAVVEV